MCVRSSSCLSSTLARLPVDGKMRTRGNSSDEAAVTVILVAASADGGSGSLASVFSVRFVLLSRGIHAVEEAINSVREK